VHIFRIKAGVLDVMSEWESVIRFPSVRYRPRPLVGKEIDIDIYTMILVPLFEEDTTDTKILYRNAKSFTDGSFWTPSLEYMDFISVNKDNTTFKAKIKDDAKILYRKNDANNKDIQKAKQLGYDIVVFPMWDFPADEYVVLNSDILEIL
jgi:hypothetical protein